MTNAVFCILITTVTSAATYGQSQDTSPQFEVASIKPTPPPDGQPFHVGARGGPGTSDPALFICENCDLTGLVSMAFSLQGYQLTAPDWMRVTRFTLSAKVDAGATREQFRLMLQNLLADRFNLKFHYEKKEVSAYNLVVARNGPKMKASEGPLPAIDDKQPPVPRSGPPAKDADGFPTLPPGRSSYMAVVADGHAAMREADQTMERFVIKLAGQQQRPVMDATGLAGKYDFTMNWIMSRGAPAKDDSGPDLFLALQQQLGLKLENTKAMIDILVIDHMEKTPTGN